MRLSYNAAYLIGHIEQVLIPKIKKDENDIELRIAEMQKEYDSLSKFKKFWADNPKYFDAFNSPFYFQSMNLHYRMKVLNSYLKTFKNHRLIDPVILDSEDVKFLEL